MGSTASMPQTEGRRPCRDHRSPGLCQHSCTRAQRLRYELARIDWPAAPRSADAGRVGHGDQHQVVDAREVSRVAGVVGQGLGAGRRRDQRGEGTGLPAPSGLPQGGGDPAERPAAAPNGSGSKAASVSCARTCRRARPPRSSVGSGPTDSSARATAVSRARAAGSRWATTLPFRVRDPLPRCHPVDDVAALVAQLPHRHLVPGATASPVRHVVRRPGERILLSASSSAGTSWPGVPDTGAYG